MSKFYGFGFTGKGEERFIPATETIRHMAEKEVKEICNESGLKFSRVQVVQGTQRQGGTTAKKFANGSPTPRSKRR